MIYENIRQSIEEEVTGETAAPGECDHCGQPFMAHVPMTHECPFQPSHGECAEEIARLRDMLGWAYCKLAQVSFTKVDDALMLDAIKLEFIK